MDIESLPSDGLHPDPYELKLFEMFKSCDRMHCGYLNEEQLRDLCTLLELRESGALLISDLSGGGVNREKITFERFKGALLNFLGTELDGSASITNFENSAAETKLQEAMTNKGTEHGLKQRSLIISDTPSTFLDSPESSDREISPRLIVGSKKYGRRSKPSKAQQIGNGESLSDDSDEEVGGGSICERHLKDESENLSQIVQRSSSHTDIPGTNRRRRTVAHSGTRLKRCASLPAQRNAQQTIRKSLDELKNHQKQQQLSSSVESLDTPKPTVESLPRHSIVEIWQRANIPNSKNILLALGFDDEDVHLGQLYKVIEEELRSLDDEQQLTLLRATVALQSAELTTLRQAAHQLHDENAKLYSNNKDANRRISLMAAEIDERHANLEEASKKEIRLLEQKHAAIVRDLTLRMTSDREQFNNLNARLEARLKSLEEDDAKLRADLEAAHKESDDLESEQQKLQKQITDLLEENIKLNHNIAELSESAKCDTNYVPDVNNGDDVDNLERNVHSEDEILHLIEKVAALQMENTKLRDKNDELAIQVEDLNLELVRSKAKGKKTTATGGVSDSNSGEDLESSTGSIATKRRGDSPSKVHITEESPRTGKLRRCNDTALGSENSDTSGEWTALNSELRQQPPKSSKDGSNEDELTKLRLKIEELEAELKKARNEIKETEAPSTSGAAASTAATSPEERCKELEASLEQMQRAYEDCEDYWQNKLAEERQLFEKERQIYDEEQQENDKKFTELMEKVREYEEQYSKDGRLSPIVENSTLEQQYVELEAEAEAIRENAQRLLEEKAKEIDCLQNEVEDLRLRLGESVEILTGASELAKEARASSAVTQSSATSPISYLWHQSTIHEAAKMLSDRYDGYGQSEKATIVHIPQPMSPSKQYNRNLTTSEISIFSTTPIDTSSSSATSTTTNQQQQTSNNNSISPIQKPKASNKIAMVVEMDYKTSNNNGDCDTSSIASVRSFETHSVASTHNISNSELTSQQLQQQQQQTQSQSQQQSLNLATNPISTYSTATSSVISSSSEEKQRSSPSALKEELKRLKYFETTLKEQIKDLSLQRDGLVMELQQLQEARPVLERAYARTAHPSLIQRVNQLELKNRHLQNVIKQQQQYTESMVQQSWLQHQTELNDLHGRLENQGALIAEQIQRLQNADILVKDLYVENSHLTATVQRLEQQRLRFNMMQQQPHPQSPQPYNLQPQPPAPSHHNYQQQQYQQQHQQQMQRQNLHLNQSLPGMP